MASFVRRAFNQLSEFFASSGDPGAVTGTVNVYQKSSQLYAQVPTAYVSQLTPLKAPTAWPEWVAVDEMTLSGATGTVSFKTGGSGSQNYAVNGDTDKWYKLTWDLTGNASGLVAIVQFNGGGNTNQSEQQMIGANVTGSAVNVNNNAQISNSAVGSCRSSGEWICYRVNTGVTRTGTCFRITQAPASTADQVEMDGWLFNDSASNITAIDFAITTGTATGQIVLWKKAPFTWE